MVTTLPTFAIREEITAQVVDYAQFQSEIHAIRQAVFVDEQDIPAPLEIDEYDRQSHHVLAFAEGIFIGTGRLTPDGRIGRVAVSRTFRRRGAGRCIMHVLLQTARQQRLQQVVLAAQYHAVPFYEKFGFYREGHFFEALGIQHVMMWKSLV